MTEADVLKLFDSFSLKMKLRLTIAMLKQASVNIKVPGGDTLPQYIDPDSIIGAETKNQIITAHLQQSAEIIQTFVDNELPNYKEYSG